MRQKSYIFQHILRPPTYTRHTYTPQMFIYHKFHMYGTYLDPTNIYIYTIHSTYILRILNPPHSTHIPTNSHTYLIYTRPPWHIHSQIHNPHIHGPTHTYPIYSSSPPHIYLPTHIQHIHTLPIHIYQTVHIPYTHLPTLYIKPSHIHAAHTYTHIH